MTTTITIPTLETERLLLRAWRPDDLDAYAAMMADPAVMRFLGGVQSRHMAWRAMAGYAGQWVLDQFGFFAIEEKASGRFIGRCGPHYPEGWPGLEIGWTFAQTAWGHGYAVEAASASINWIFSQKPALPQVVSLIDARNTPSQNVAKRLGQKKSGAIFNHWIGGPIDIWSISREDWHANPPAFLSGSA